MIIANDHRFRIPTRRIMRIEEAIKQKTPFKSERQKAVVNLIYTHNWLIGHQKTFFKSFDITLQQYNVLRILRGQYPNPISTSEIRDRMLDKMSDVSRIVDRLVKKELVIRRVCESDKRLVDVVTNQAGLSLLEQIDHINLEIDRLTASLTEEEATNLNGLLDKMRRSVSGEDRP
jgi:DNA-binding MarR family transcriptional regulator